MRKILALTLALIMVFAIFATVVMAANNGNNGNGGGNGNGAATVAAPSTFPFGTQLVINGQIYVVEDRGGAIQGNRLDIYFNSHREALNWGVRYVDVEIL